MSVCSAWVRGCHNELLIGPIDARLQAHKPRGRWRPPKPDPSYPLRKSEVLNNAYTLQARSISLTAPVGSEAVTFSARGSRQAAGAAAGATASERTRTVNRDGCRKSEHTRHFGQARERDRVSATRRLTLTLTRLCSYLTSTQTHGPRTRVRSRSSAITSRGALISRSTMVSLAWTITSS